MEKTPTILYVITDNKVERKECYKNPDSTIYVKYNSEYYYYDDDGIGIRPFEVDIGVNAFHTKGEAIEVLLSTLVPECQKLTKCINELSWNLVEWALEERQKAGSDGNSR